MNRDVHPVRMQAPGILFFQVHQPTLLSSFHFEFSVQISVKTASIDNLFFFFLLFCLPNLEDCEPAVLTPPHLMPVIVLRKQRKKTVVITNLSLFFFFLKLLKLAMHAGHVRFFPPPPFFVLEDVLFVGWLQHDIHSSFYGLLTFLGQQQKSDRTPPHPTPVVSIRLLHFNCVEVRLNLHLRRLSLGCRDWARCVRPSWKLGGGIMLRGGERKVVTFKETAKPPFSFSGILVCCLKPTVI